MMQRDNGSILVLLLVILGGALYPRITAPPARDSPHDAVTKAIREGSGSASAGSSLCAALLEVFGKYAGRNTLAEKLSRMGGLEKPCERCAATLSGAEKIGEAECITCSECLSALADSGTLAALGSPPPLKFLIALVPDPIESRVGWRFDEYLSAILRAIERAGYVLDRFVLPWDSAARKAGTTADRSREHGPGVVLFRKADSLLILFIVGETPTYGIAINAFLAAVKVIRATDPESAIKVVGPTFSGSIDSLHRALQHACTEPPLPSFEIISGSATGDNNRERLLRNGIDACATYFATVWPDERMFGVLRTYIAPDAKIAILSEAGTAYGEAFDSVEPVDSKGVLRFPYPLHLSDVRQGLGGSDTSPDRVGAGLPRPKLGLPTGEDDGARDVVPTFSPGRTAATEELKLSGIFSSMAAKDISHVGILGSDPIDKLFLAQQVRTYLPDVELFTFESELLYNHPSYVGDTSGMIVVSTYPLFGQNHEWTDPAWGHRYRLQLGIDGAQGAYNAVLALLASAPLCTIEPVNDADAHSKDRTANPKLLEYSPPKLGRGAAGIDDCEGPPLWISVIGRDGPWPLLYEPGHPLPEELVKTNPRQETPTLRVAFDLAWALLTSIGALTLLTVIGIGKAATQPSQQPLSGGWQLFEAFRRRQCDGCSDTQRQYLMVTAAALVIAHAAGAYSMVLPLASVAWTMGWDIGSNAVWAGTALFCVAAVAAVVVCVTLAYRCATEDCSPTDCAVGGRAHTQRGRVLSRWLTIGIGALGLVTAGLLVFNGLRDPAYDEMAFLRYERSRRFANGLSPLIPLLLLCGGLVWFGLAHLKRLRLLEAFRIPLPLSQTARLEGAAFATLEQRLLDGLSGPMRSAGTKSWAIFAIVGLWATINLAPRFHANIDPIWSGWIPNATWVGAWLLIPGCALMLGLTLLQVSSVWRRLRRMLARLGAHPLLPAYGRLPAAVRTGGGLLWSRLPSLNDVELQVHHVRVLRQSVGASPSPTTELRDTLDSAESLDDQLNSELQKEAEGGHRFPLSNSRAERTLERVAAAVADSLASTWAVRVVNGADDKEAGDTKGLATNGGTSVDQKTWIRLAEDLVALRITAFIHTSVGQVRNLLTFLSGAALLLVVAIESYPFQPHGLLRLYAFTLVGLITATALYIVVQMDRDVIVSRLTHTEPNRVAFLDRNFISAVLLYAVLPMLSLAAAVLPEMRGLYSLVEPLARLMK